jgi:hypothetical protein
MKSVIFILTTGSESLTYHPVSLTYLYLFETESPAWPGTLHSSASVS